MNMSYPIIEASLDIAGATGVPFAAVDLFQTQKDPTAQPTQ